VLSCVLFSPPSNRKTGILLTYFLLWSLFGPAVHTLLPAAGPVFYARLGYGARFASMPTVAETSDLAKYLWRIYSSTTFGPGAGISAMPSLHIATSAWMVIAVRVVDRRLVIPMAAAAALIFALSISLGWHYAVDGLVGAAGAVGIWFACDRLLARLKPSAQSQFGVPVHSLA
jgi:membrane-associated phospholipid phosphatase